MAEEEDQHLEREVEEEEAAEEEDEFLIWKKNTPLLYDVVISSSLEWPSLTVQWLPDHHQGPSHKAHKLILGTHTSDDEPNSLMIAQVHIPTNTSEDFSQRISDPPTVRANVEIVQWIAHKGEVNRARCMPQNSSIIATKSPNSDVYVFNYEKYPSRPVDESVCTPLLTLKGHTDEGYGLSWNCMKEGQLLSGSHDAKICLWDINAPCENGILQAKQTFQAHVGVIEDVSWHIENENVFGSAGDDCHLLIWDIRTRDSSKPQNSIIAHEKEVNSLSFSRFKEWLLATCSSDKTVNLFDLRKLTYPLHTFTNHSEEVFQVSWSPTNGAILASSGADKNVMIWDLERIGDEQSPEDAEDGPPELLFIHGGHASKISEFSWNPNDEWVIASAEEDNILQIWQVAQNIYQDED